MYTSGSRLHDDLEIALSKLRNELCFSSPAKPADAKHSTGMMTDDNHFSREETQLFDKEEKYAACE